MQEDETKEGAEDEGAEKDGKEKEFQPPKDGSWIPKDRFDEAINRLKSENQAVREQNIRLEERFKADVKEDKSYSRAELRKMVDEEQINQEQADSIIESQLEKKLEKKLNERLDSATKEQTKGALVNQELARYQSVIPDLMNEGSDNRRRVAEEFSSLIAIGQPNSVATELAALRIVFGPVDKAERRNRKLELETHQETGGGDKPSEFSKGILKTMSAREKTHYQGQIDKGQLKNWDAVEAELKYANPDLRKRMGAKL